MVLAFYPNSEVRIGKPRLDTEEPSAAAPQPEERWLWSAVTCHRFPEATCRRRTVGRVSTQRGLHGSRQRRRARVTGCAQKFDGDQSPAQKR